MKDIKVDRNREAVEQSLNTGFGISNTPDKAPDSTLALSELSGREHADRFKLTAALEDVGRFILSYDQRLCNWASKAIEGVGKLGNEALNTLMAVLDRTTDYRLQIAALRELAAIPAQPTDNLSYLRQFAEKSGHPRVVGAALRALSQAGR